jgi:hypothetical protein
MAGRATQKLRAGMQLFLITITVGVCACHEGTPGPSQFSTPYDSTPPDTLLAYINSLHFDQREWAGDAQRLMLGTCPQSCRYGPLVRIEPERRAHRNSAADLEHRQGRNIARMINTDPIAYPKFNLAARDTVFWAVSKVRPSRGDTAYGITMYISLRGLRGTRSPAITYGKALVEKHSSYRDSSSYSSSFYPSQALAQWVWSDSDETKWGNCTDGGCCR